LKSFSLPDYLF